ncbi:MAG: acyltransferase [Solirubrobacterales bacterium]|nr:acyltransferase [Solirubrobacterales bacterium]
MGYVRKGLRAGAVARREARFRAWAARLDFELRRRGSRLVLDADAAPTWETAPSIEPIAHALSAPTQGEAPTFTLRLGRDVHLGRGLTIEFRPDGANLLELGDGVHLQDGNRFVLADGRISFGARGRLRSGSILKSSGDLLMGEQVILAYHCVVHCAERIELGDLVGISDRSTLVDSSHTVDGSDIYYYEQPIVTTPIVLERNVIVSANVMVLRGAHVERNAQLGGGAVVLKGRYPAGWLVGGNPAKPVRPLGPAARPWTPGEAEGHEPGKRLVTPLRRGAVAV